MKRITQAYIVARNTISKRNAQYEYKYILPVSVLLLLIGFFLNNIIGDILVILGLIGSPLYFLLEGFWIFIIYLIKPN